MASRCATGRQGSGLKPHGRSQRPCSVLWQCEQVGEQDEGPHPMSIRTPCTMQDAAYIVSRDGVRTGSCPSPHSPPRLCGVPRLRRCWATQVITLDLGLLVAGTKYRGEFEERLKKLMEEIKQNDDIILVRFPINVKCQPRVAPRPLCAGCVGPITRYNAHKANPYAALSSTRTQCKGGSAEHVPRCAS